MFLRAVNRILLPKYICIFVMSSRVQSFYLRNDVIFFLSFLKKAGSRRMALWVMFHGPLGENTEGQQPAAS